MTLFLVQALNGLQLGVLLFLIAAGLTLVFGVMDVIDLAHGVQYMLGAYFAVVAQQWTGSFLLALLLATAGLFAIGLLLDRLVFRRLLGRDHLAQVLATYVLILLLEKAVRVLLGPGPRSLSLPALLSGTVALPGGLNHPSYRLVLLAAGLGLAALLWAVIGRTRAGILVRAGASKSTCRGCSRSCLPPGRCSRGCRRRRRAVDRRRAQHGQQRAHRGLRPHRGGRRGVGARSLCRGAARGAHRHIGAQLHHRRAAAGDGALGRPDGRAGAGVDVHLSVDGRRAGFSAAGLLPARGRA